MPRLTMPPETIRDALLLHAMGEHMRALGTCCRRRLPLVAVHYPLDVQRLVLLNLSADALVLAISQPLLFRCNLKVATVLLFHCALRVEDG